MSRSKLGRFVITGRAEIAAELGVSTQRVSQIERDAVMKLRALVFGTDDFPLLRESILGTVAAKAIEEDVAYTSKLREHNAAWTAKRKKNR